jgi:serine/threonine-protein kinase
MATVHLGQLTGPFGFSRIVAVKRLHSSYSQQPEFAAMLVDEARIAARVRHPNVIPTLDVYVDDGACLVMEYVEGESLAKLLQSASQAQAPPPLAVIVAVMAGVLHGLHAAHAARSARGEPLNIMHRDVSPQNILVGTDGVARIFDFGVAKARGRLQQTRVGEFKGKLPYMAPEQFGEGPLTQRIDIYSASVTLWEALTLRRLFDGDSEQEIFAKVLRSAVPPPSQYEPSIPQTLDAIVLRGLSRAPESRYSSAEEMAVALWQALAPAEPLTVGAWVRERAADALLQRSRLIHAVEDGIVPSDLSSASATSSPTLASPKGNLVAPAISAKVLQADLPAAAPTDVAAAAPSQEAPRPARAALTKRSQKRLRMAPLGLAVAAVLLLATVGTALRSQSHVSATEQLSPPDRPAVQKLQKRTISGSSPVAPVASATVTSPEASSGQPESAPPVLSSASRSRAKQRQRGPISAPLPARRKQQPTYLETEPYVKRK